MTRTMKHQSIAIAAVGLLLAATSGALAQQQASDPHHPNDPPAASDPASQAKPAMTGQLGAPMQGAGMGAMMGDEQMSMMMPMMMKMMPMMMKMMRENMMGSDMATAQMGDTGPSSQAFSGAAEKMHRDMSLAFTGNVDVDFVKHMIPQHQGAIDMAKTVLAFGKDPEIRAVAEGIVEAQEAEMSRMKEWLQKQEK